MKVAIWILSIALAGAGVYIVYDLFFKPCGCKEMKNKIVTPRNENLAGGTGTGSQTPGNTGSPTALEDLTIVEVPVRTATRVPLTFGRA